MLCKLTVTRRKKVRCEVTLLPGEMSSEVTVTHDLTASVFIEETRECHGDHHQGPSENSFSVSHALKNQSTAPGTIQSQKGKKI